MDADKRYLKKIKAAHLIYKEQMALQDVAKLLGVSRPTLTKLIDEMLEEGIVNIQIKYPSNTRENLEVANKVRRKYGLRDVVVTSASTPDSEDIFESIGSAGADYFQDILRKDMVVGATGGRTIYSLVSNVSHNSKITGLRIITTTGGSLYANTTYHANTVVQRLADCLNATGHFIYAPTYADDSTQHAILLGNSQIKSTLDMCKKVDIVLSGIADTEAALCYLPKPNDKWIDKGAEKEIVGAINTLLIRADGSPLEMPISKLFVGLAYEDLKRVETVIALAGGKRKHAAVKAALLGGYVSVLVTDQFTAEYLLQ